jgi:serine phosphatase RsbU (regulator of sigma subunit)
MPAKSEMDNYFDSFLIYKPKDIVSGDFAWFSKIEKTKKGKAYCFVAIVDCTGHGVPGAFMSMIGSRLLNEIVNEKQITDPSEVLELLNIGVQTALRQKDTDNNDGMDVCLCRLENIDSDENLDKTKGKERNILVTFSGAKRPLFYFKDENEIETVRGDRKSIGGVRSKRSSVNFTNTEIVLKSGDWLYLTTDGIIDQNGIDRKRFGSGRFVEVLTQMRIAQPEEQGKALDSALIEYQDKEEQRDDITVLGIRL